MTFEGAVSVLAVVFTVSFAWPQVFRALRHGVDGISGGAVTQSLISASAWFGYGLALWLPPVMLADIGVIAGQVIVVATLVHFGTLHAWRAVGVVATAVGLIALSQVTVLTTPIVIIAGAVGLTSALTQLVEVIREPDKLEGLSGGSYAILTGVAASWLAYGLIHGDMVIIVTNVIMIPMSSYIAWIASRSHHEHEAEYEPEHEHR